MMKSLLILGRQPEIGLAELESLFGFKNIQKVGNAALLDKTTNDVSLDRLGGTMKLCKMLTVLPYADWDKITEYLVEHVPKHTCCYEPGKLTFGISVYGFNLKPKRINATALSVKKAVRVSGRPVRVVPNKSTELNSAQIIHNKLTDLPLGMELVLVKDSDKTLLAQTVAVQDIEAYAARDQKRPKRDAKVGMLPPKLAQIIINLAGTHTLPSGASPTEADIDNSKVHKPKTTLLDPFCGTGVILQEALLMGYDIRGTDLDPRMVEYSKANLDWLTTDSNLQPQTYNLSVGDATSYQWEEFDVIACETYLGRPFSALPKTEVLDEVIKDVATIHKKFLKNLAGQTDPGFRLCVAVPAWKVGSGFRHLPTLDSLEKLGYTRLKFAHAPREKIVYHRPGQIVGRELVVLKRM